MKKIIALVLAFVMAFGITVPALAAEGPADTQTDLVDSTDPVDTETPEEPIAEKLGYADYVKMRADDGKSRISDNARWAMYIPVSFLVWWYPMVGLAITVNSYSGFFRMLVGIGELIFSPIIAVFDMAAAK